MNKRKNRRYKKGLYDLPPDPACIRLPSLQEIKESLGNVRNSTNEILRLAALMDNLSLYLSPRLTDSNDYRGRTPGIRKYLEQDGYLISRYSTLMRFKKLGRAIREKCNILMDTNLLWGFLPESPIHLDDYVQDWTTIRNLYVSFEGMNFKQITNSLLEKSQI